MEEDWKKLIVVDCCQGAGSTGEAALKLGCMYIGNDIDPEMVEVCDHRFKEFSKWQEKPPSFHVGEWRKKVNWGIFASQIQVEDDIVEVEEEEEGTFFKLFTFILINNISLRKHLWRKG